MAVFLSLALRPSAHKVSNLDVFPSEVGLTHQLQRLIYSIRTILCISQRGTKLIQTPERDACRGPIRSRTWRPAKTRRQVTNTPKGLHDDASAVSEVRVAHGGAEHDAAGLLDEEVGVWLGHAGGAVGVEDGDDDACGVDVCADSPLGAVGEELDAGFEVEAVGDDGACRVEDADGVRFYGWDGDVGRGYEVA